MTYLLLAHADEHVHMHPETAVALVVIALVVIAFAAGRAVLSRRRQ